MRIARTNVPESKFILGDIRKLDLQPIYDAVISIDVFCHILNLEELTTVFQKVYTAMRCNGIFAFTTPTVEEAWLTTIFENRYNFEYFNRIIEGDTSILIERYYNHNHEEKIREVKFTSLELINEVWQRSDSTMLVKDYLISEIKSALANAGFIEINKYSSRDFGDDGPVSAPLFVCRKPSVLQ
ncbi:class I SAM-dependent methyltransferase [Nostoc favosum]|uniref:methyltransferase domain-containing protein n=1 Tax=Nostoc favosum TaxID=2907819 RepID=UPI001E3F2ECC|nr:class I SAM-dependent methyltransferase [Nostoc favosum]